MANDLSMFETILQTCVDRINADEFFSDAGMSVIAWSDGKLDARIDKAIQVGMVLTMTLGAIQADGTEVQFSVYLTGAENTEMNRSSVDTFQTLEATMIKAWALLTEPGWQAAEYVAPFTFDELTQQEGDERTGFVKRSLKLTGRTSIGYI